MHAFDNQNDLFSALLNKHTIITPNNRLSMQIMQDLMNSKTATVVDKPKCMPYQNFLHNCFLQLKHLYPNINHPILLTNQQERALWLQIISINHEKSCNEGLLNEIQSASTRCHQWQIDIKNGDFELNSQSLQFKNWHEEFCDRLKKIIAITQSQLADYVLSYPDCLPKNEVIWACFDDFTPQQKSIIAALDMRNIRQSRYDIKSKINTAKHYVADDNKDEITQLCIWLQTQLDSGKNRIGVVVPELQSQSTELQRRIQRHLSFEKFNISLGKTLIDFPLVSHALSWLKLDNDIITHEQIRLILNSPYIASAKTEFYARSELLENESLMQELNLPFAAVVNNLQERSPELAKCMKKINEYPQQATPAEWSLHFQNRLNILGFPGEYSMSSATYQCLERFVLIFDELKNIGLIEPIMSCQNALATIYDLAKTTIFQPRIAAKPIQILGLLEASGCVFDSIWICGLTDQCLPQKTKLSAFIPIEIQRKHQMPRSLPEREWALSKQTIQRLHDSCDEIILSYPKITGDMPNLPSPLLNGLDAYNKIDITPADRTKLRTIDIEDYKIAPAVNESISGGTSLLANQAKCPFRAFAAHRLHARRGLELSTGPNDAERGQIVHRIMEIIWLKIKTQSKLLELADDSLNNLIDDAIYQALSPFSAQRNCSFPPLVKRIEEQRLKQLIKSCLNWDKQREPFHIESTEKAYSIKLSGLTFNVRIDRLDQNEDGGKWVIDYKSSLPASKPWNENRPESPQLLLYALLDKSINTLLFLQLKTGQIAASGISEEKLELRGISQIKKNETWPEKQQLWQQQLSALAQELQDGHCPPTPQRASTCQRCEFIDLCRR